MSPWTDNRFKSSPNSFIESYDKIMTPNVQHAVERQEFGDLFVNSDGVMVGNGQLWFTGVCPDATCSTHELRVIAFNP